MTTRNFTPSLEEYILQWAKRHHRLDRNGTLEGKNCYDVGYDMKPDIEVSIFNEAPRDCFDYWFEFFLDDCIVPILLNLGAKNA